MTSISRRSAAILVKNRLLFDPSEAMRKSPVLIVVCLTCVCFSQVAGPSSKSLAPETQNAIDRIRASSLRGDLAFLASDLLEGRDTPSRGLDVAAEYIAAQFRSEGLEAGGDDGYFQTARMAISETNWGGFELKLTGPEGSFDASQKDATIDAAAGLDVSSAPVFKLDLSDAALVRDLSAEQVEAKVVVTQRIRGSLANYRTAAGKLRTAKPAAILIVDPRGAAEDQQLERRLVDPEGKPAGTPRITLRGQTATQFYAALKAGPTDAVASIHVAA